MKEGRHRIILQELDRAGLEIKGSFGCNGYDHSSRFN